MAGEMVSFPMDATKYTAEDFGFWIGERTRGIYSHKDSDGNEGYFKVAPSASGGMAVTVSDGIAWLKMKDFWGVSSLLKTAAGSTELTLGASDTALNRVDAVCIQLNKKTYKANVIIKAGTPAANPTLPSRVNNDDYDEIYVASVYVGKGAAAITGDNITDLRDNSVYCGYMTDAVVTDAQKLGGVMASGYAKSTSPNIYKALNLNGDGTRRLNVRWSSAGAGDNVFLYVIPDGGEAENGLVSISSTSGYFYNLKIKDPTELMFSDDTLKTAAAEDNKNVDWDYFRAFKIPNAAVVEFSAMAKTGVWTSNSAYKIFKMPAGFIPRSAFSTSLELVQNNNDALLRNGVTIGTDGWMYVLTQGNSDFTRMKGKIIIPASLLK